MKVVFCLPGTTFSWRFLQCWTNTINYCLANGIQPLVSQAQSNNVYMVRNKCLGADVMRGAEQQPFNGQLDYSKIVWLDADSVWTPQQLQRLLNHDVAIVGALQPFEGGSGYTCGWLDAGFFKANGYMPYLTDEKLKTAQLAENGLLLVDYCGLGMLVVKRGVYEALPYPWHRPVWFNYTINGKEVTDFSMDDVGWAMQAKQAGFQVYVDPAVRIGHEKTVVW